MKYKILSKKSSYCGFIDVKYLPRHTKIVRMLDIIRLKDEHLYNTLVEIQIELCTYHNYLTCDYSFDMWNLFDD